MIFKRLDILVKRIRNRIPEGLADFLSRKLLPYLSIILVAAFTLVANYAKAAEHNYSYDYSEEMMDLSPADVAQVVSVVGPEMPNINAEAADPVNVALALEDSSYLDKPVISETKITEEPKAPEKRSKTIVYIVEDNDTLSKIAWKYSLKIATIKSANNLTGDTIRTGQKLNITPQDIAPSQLQNLQTKKVAGAKTPFAGTFRRPTAGWSMSQGFGRTSFESFHDGVDLEMKCIFEKICTFLQLMNQRFRVTHLPHRTGAVHQKLLTH